MIKAMVVLQMLIFIQYSDQDFSVLIFTMASSLFEGDFFLEVFVLFL